MPKSNRNGTPRPVEGEIREFVRRDVVANPGPDNEPQLEASI